MKVSENNENKRPYVLTCIHDAYTLSTTQDDDSSEVDKVIIANFLQTLAEIALTVAFRDGGQSQ